MFEAYSCLGILDAFAEASTDAVERPGQFFDNMKMIDDDRDAREKARCKILCKRFSTKSRMALESRADSGLNPLITESHGGQSGMRAGTA